MTDILLDWAPYRLQFKFEARTSRETMRVKDTYIVRARRGDEVAYGECALFRGLSADDVPNYEQQLSRFCSNPGEIASCPFSSIRFGIETALLNLEDPGRISWKKAPHGIAINGLIWMGDKDTMARRIKDKLDEGFRVLKLKIGGIHFEDELELLELIRRNFPPQDLEIRLDANGSFSPSAALSRLDALSHFSIHSIEQPIKAGQPELMHMICAKSPLPIALDEELIGTCDVRSKESLLSLVMPQYIILKPALCGGLSGASEWASVADGAGVPYWFTSALESNIGLDAIARLAIDKGLNIPQGLGTGELYFNNIQSPIIRRGPRIFYDSNSTWNVPELNWTTTAS
ncbi:MAG: o-succinylbenzoate synthase [Muribaculaceae bacterium]|nr:o-succinylbenzoate synthase [Muribaculaceae bacterium]